MCLLEGVGHHSPNISEIARKLIKSRPCCKRNGQGLFCDPFFVTVYCFPLVVGKIDSGPFTIWHTGNVPRVPLNLYN